MRLYTRPRPLHPYLVVVGDEVAVHGTAKQTRGLAPITSEAEYIDATLRKAVRWAGVHAVDLAPEPPEGGLRRYVVIHTFGQHLALPNSLLIVRDWVEVQAHVCLTPAGD